MPEDIAIKVERVSKNFVLPHEKITSVKSLFTSLARGKLGKTKETQHALKSVSFEIKKGEFFGIVGRNGSGKSTLLKLLAGIYQPTTGRITTQGKIIPFIELGVGFNAELTGRENVFLNGALLGFSRKEMTAMYDDIVSFAELERFMDQKLKNYSSGMQVRLAFSIAIRAKSDIMLIDEVLAVGDAAFQRKCFSYFAKLKRTHQTVVFVSHDMESVRKYCDRAILIEDGHVTESGDVERVIRAYTGLFLEEAASLEHQNKKSHDIPLGMSPSSRIDSNKLTIESVWVEDESGDKVKSLHPSSEQLFVKFTVSSKAKDTEFVPGVIIANATGEFISASSSYWAPVRTTLKLPEGRSGTVTFKVPNIYEKGDYKISVNIVSADLETFYAWKNEAVNLYVDKKFVTGGKVNPAYEVDLSL